MSARRRTLPLWESDHPYAAETADQAAPSLDEYAANNADVAVVVVPGGGYTHKAPHEGGPIAERLNEYGFSAYVLDYRVSPCPALAPLTDARRAIRAVRALGYRHVGILGFSAGGNVACNAAVHFDPGDPASPDPLERLSSRPDFLISCYAVVSFCQYPHVGSVLALLGDGSDMARRRYFSAELNVGPDAPPAFIWHTATDESVPVENSLLLAGAFARQGVPFELHIYPEGVHGIGLADGTPGAKDWPRDCARFIRKVCGA